MKIIERDLSSGWVTAIINKRWVQAKVYNEPSTFGINNGRVSKCAIGKTDKRKFNSNYFDQLAYHYDRGLDFNNLSEIELQLIINELEKLPKLNF